jgi:aspartyl-tRNA synthetase
MKLQIDFTQLEKFTDQVITIAGFVHIIRDHGGLIFIDLRNETTTIQAVIEPTKNPEEFELAQNIKPEYVLELTGLVRKRSTETINTEIINGKIEILVEKIKIVAKSKPLPFNIHVQDGELSSEELRLKYRYLDLRRAKLKNLLKLRHDLFLETRNWFDKEGFYEIQTPILANSSPEGARDYLVPSRLHLGSFYALPQAPQQFKQLLMVGGFNKYFQIAPCFRDEDPRSDRHPGDFYQLDVEMAFVKQEDIFDFFEKYISEVITNPKINNKTIVETQNFLQLTYQEAMDGYGSDKPDLRYDLKWENVKDLFISTGFSAFANLANQKDAKVQALVLKNMSDRFSRSNLDKIQDIGRSFGLPGIAYIQYQDNELKSPITKFLTETEIENIKAKLGLTNNDLVLFLAHEDKNLIYKAQNSIRTHIAQKENLIDKSKIKFVWIKDMPFFESDDKTGKIDFGHNPFSMWQSDEGLTPIETLQKYIKEDRLLELKAFQYDVACNGYEILSGGIRNNDPEAIKLAFLTVGYTEEDLKNRFKHIMEAYEFGSPYHGGFAVGIERLIMILTDETNIREVIPFPKNGSGLDVMTQSPSKVSQKQLKELSIKIEE